jgi:hypothetical protein
MMKKVEKGVRQIFLLAKVRQDLDLLQQCAQVPRTLSQGDVTIKNM